MKHLIIFLMFFSNISYAKQKYKIIYKYKKFESFDLEGIDVPGLSSGTGDLSVTPRFQKKFKNKLPYKKNFNKEMRKSIETIR